MSNQYDLFPVDDATLDLLEAGIVNAGGEHSGLYSMLSFLSGNLDHDHDTAGCERVEPDVWVCIGHMNPEHTPQGVILALIAEVRRLRGRTTEQPERVPDGWRPMSELPNGHDERVWVAYEDGSVAELHGSLRYDDAAGRRLWWRPIEPPAHPGVGR